MVAMEKLIFKLVDPIQEFILRRLLGELQEVNRKSSKSPSLQSALIPLAASSDVCVFCFFCVVPQLFDVERAELYLCVLRQLVVIYSSTPQHHNTIQQTYFPKLIKYSLKVLQEPSQQVKRQIFKPQPGRHFINEFGCFIIQH